MLLQQHITDSLATHIPEGWVEAMHDNGHDDDAKPFEKRHESQPISEGEETTISSAGGDLGMQDEDVRVEDDGYIPHDDG